jgi:hypothetical protein
LPTGVSAKPEALALAEEDAFVFLDAPRYGGVRRFKRSEFERRR